MLYKARRVEFCKSKFVNEFFQRNSVLQANGDSNGETVHHAAHGSSFFRHVNEDLSQCPISIFTCTQEYSLSIDLCFLSEASSLGGKRTTFYDTRQFSFQFRIR